MGHETEGTEPPNRLFQSETLRKHCNKILGADYRWEQAGEVPHMGELPPSCSTPQGPGGPRASRPGFLRVDSSGTSSAPSSRSASFPFLASSSLHFTHLLSPGAFPPPSRSPLPSPSFPFLASSSLRFSPLSSARISSGWFLCLGCVFPFFPLPCVQFFPVRLRFPQLPLSFLLLPSPSFPFLSSSSLRFSPLSSASFSRRLPAH